MILLDTILVHRFSGLLLVVAFLLVFSACGIPSSETQSEKPNPSAVSSQGSTLPPTPTATIGRVAIFTSISNDVQARPADAATFAPAVLGQELFGGAEARSGDDSRARLDLEPDGTIVRLAPNSLLTVGEIDPDQANPFTRLELFFGQLWVILNGGELEIETSLGIASVRGSYMSVAFDPGKKTIFVTCLEGHCALGNAYGMVELIDGQASGIEGEAAPPSAPRGMSDEEYQEWIEASPEAESLIVVDDSLFPDVTLPQPPGDSVPVNPLYYKFFNGCDGYEGRPLGKWIIRILRLPDDYGDSTIEQLFIAPGDTVTGVLLPGWYLLMDIAPGGDVHVPDLVSSGLPILLNACVPSPVVVTPDGSIPPPPDRGTQAATVYTLINNCPDVWYWQFVGAQTVNFTIQPWETITGTLPPGDYYATDWRSSDSVHGPDFIPAGGNLHVEGCPDRP